MTKTEVLELFQRRAGPALLALGFEGQAGHFVRSRGAITQVIELQHSIYGGRVTANLGLDLPGLLPPVRWIPQPTIGPHAHDAARWVRIGMAMPERADRWWAFTDQAPSVVEAIDGLGGAITGYGLDWLDREGAWDALLRHAEERLERSRSPICADGGFLELRLLTARHAEGGDARRARSLFRLAAALWPAELKKLEAARRHYLEKNHPPGTKLKAVPDLLAELEALIGPTKAASSRPRAPASEKRKRSRSARPGSSPG